MIDPNDLHIDAYPIIPPGAMRVGMPRGVRVLHKPTGITISVNCERSQHRNRHIALVALEAALKEIQ